MALIHAVCVSLSHTHIIDLIPDVNKSILYKRIGRIIYYLHKCVDVAQKDTVVKGRVPRSMIHMYEAVLDDGYSPSEIAREGIRALYRQKSMDKVEATA